MKKSTYSVVLSDRVVAEIDRLAYRKGTNRSSMINEILAGYVSMTTPEQRSIDSCIVCGTRHGDMTGNILHIPYPCFALRCRLDLPLWFRRKTGRFFFF